MKHALTLHMQSLLSDAPHIRDLVNAALCDLYNGDDTQDGYPGFEEACRVIRQWARYEVRSVWYCEDTGDVLDDAFTGHASLLRAYREEGYELTCVSRTEIINAAFDGLGEHIS